ncbi:hypothetical protein [Klebsiella pneumoniae]|nr:hypothetical protein [Klebsiella pneumoniae]
MSKIIDFPNIFRVINCRHPYLSPFYSRKTPKILYDDWYHRGASVSGRGI